MKTAFAVLAALAVVGCAAAADSYRWDKSCGTQYDRFDTSTLTMTAPGGFRAGATATVVTTGTTDLHVPLQSGAWSIRVYEIGQAHPVYGTDGDLMTAVKFLDAKNTTFQMTTDFVMPKPTSSGHFIVSYYAVDQAKATYFCVTIYYNLSMSSPKPLAMRVDELERRLSSLETYVASSGVQPRGSYCMRDPVKSPPYYCHQSAPIYCKTDGDCNGIPGSWCVNSDGHAKPYQCHLPAPKQCDDDFDCQTW